MKYVLALVLAIMAAAPVAAQTPQLKATEIARFPAKEAGQGVAVDAHYFYAVVNRAIGKYDKKSGLRVAGWRDLQDGAFIHLNSCKALENLLRCAHSNFPGIPMTSSIEYFDKDTLQPVASHSLGIAHGSLTWIDEKDDAYWAVFANYDDRGGTPGQGSEWSQLVKFDKNWSRIGGWTFPKSILSRMRPASSSGGAWGPDGLLYVSGHDHPELYVLRLPKAGSELMLVATIAVPIEGQAFAFDPASRKPVVYGISRPRREIVVFQLPPIDAPDSDVE